MTNQNNEFGKSPVKLSSPTQIWIDDVNQNNELRASIYSILLDVGVKKSNVSAVTDSIIQALYAPKPVEKVNKTTNSVDLTKPEVNLIDIASPTMTPEASKVVSDAIERSAEVMNKVAKPVENKELPTAVTVKNVLKMVVAHTQSNKQDFLNASLDVAKELELNGKQELADYIYAQFKLIRTFEVND